VLCDQYLQAHEQTNCLTMMFVEAERWAGECDARLQDKSETSALSPIFGIPCSVKEFVAVKGKAVKGVAEKMHACMCAGYDSTIGFAQFIHQPMADDCAYVRVLRAAGAVPFAHTNNPQTCLSGIASNPIYGETTHAHSRTLCAGGSSSGEGALIAARGSVFGTGTDVGGSIRLPSHFNGIFGLRPSSLRVSQVCSMSGALLTHSVG
jgi:Asp-tRNA(Asn)/Glu-tRNA(Gln) amidotransferase A subunit family amidase